MFLLIVEHMDELLQGILSTGLASVAGLAAAVAIGSLLAILFSQSRKLRLLALFPFTSSCCRPFPLWLLPPS